MGSLNKEDVLAVNDLKVEEVDVPEWKGTVRVRMMTGADRDAFESSLVTIDADGTRRPNLDNMKCKLVTFTMVDEAGNRMFTLDEIGHLAGKSAAALNRVFEAASRLNALGAAAEEQAEKNSVAALSGSSTTA